MQVKPKSDEKKERYKPKFILRTITKKMMIAATPENVINKFYELCYL